MDLAHLLEAVDTGQYIVDLEKGTIVSKRTKRQTFIFNHVWPPNPNQLGHWFTRLYYKGTVLCTSRARIIWMVGHRRAIPEGFEIHHDNEDSEDDSFDNLICIYNLDHKKLHRNGNGKSNGHVPF